ncbi:unnamed protein product [Calypogeia fissa]
MVVTSEDDDGGWRFLLFGSSSSSLLPRGAGCTLISSSAARSGGQGQGQGRGDRFDTAVEVESSTRTTSLAGPPSRSVFGTTVDYYYCYRYAYHHGEDSGIVDGLPFRWIEREGRPIEAVLG